ncbi:MAG TPA: VOC family protein [Baekduia sp.]|nr:VOC family protein [Baekduia sp.]
MSTYGAGIAHVGHIELVTPRIDASVEFFTGVLGMTQVGEEGDSVYLRGYGDYQRACLKLTAGSQAALGHLALRTHDRDALEALASTIPNGEWNEGDIGHGAAYRFQDPDGHRLELYFDVDRYEAPAWEAPPAKNEYQRRGGVGVGVKRLDHVNLFCADVAKNRAFAESTLGYRTLDLIVDDDEAEIGAFMTRTIAPLELIYTCDLAGRSGLLHHTAFWVDTREEVLRAADILSGHGIAIEVPPAQHTIGRSFFVYAFEPGGHRIEVTTGADFVYEPDATTRIWTAAERGAGVGWGTKFPSTWTTHGT